MGLSGYTRVTWTEAVPITPANLNTMDEGLYDLDTLLDGELAIVQFQSGTCAAGENTTESTSYVNSNLSVAITPKYNNSKIFVMAFFTYKYNTSPYAVYIYNNTDAANVAETLHLPGDATEQELTPFGLYTVNSLTERIFVVRYRGDTSRPGEICATIPGMIIAVEVKQ